MRTLRLWLHTFGIYGSLEFWGEVLSLEFESQVITDSAEFKRVFSSCVPVSNGRAVVMLMELPADTVVDFDRNAGDPESAKQ